MNATWQALSNEAGVAAEHMAIGATALGKANYAHKAHYGQAFFALTIGFERAAKLALVVDHALEHDGSFPRHNVLRAYGHKLDKLLEQADDIANRRGFASEERLPQTDIHKGIIKVLSDFADNITRYYNLDFITGDPRVATQNPMAEWHDLVVSPILDLHYHRRFREKIEGNARIISALLDNHVMVLHHSERGEELNSTFEASVQTGMTKFATPHVRMYVMQIARFLARLLSNLGYASASESIPYFSEFFAIFNNEDAYFRGRKTWSIYRP